MRKMRGLVVKIKVNATGSLNQGLPIIGNPKSTIQISCEPKYRSSPLTIFWVRTIGTVCGNFLRSYGSAETRTGEMFESQVGSYAKSGSGRSFLGVYLAGEETEEA